MLNYQRVTIINPTNPPVVYQASLNGTGAPCLGSRLARPQIGAKLPRPVRQRGARGAGALRAVRQ